MQFLRVCSKRRQCDPNIPLTLPTFTSHPNWQCGRSFLNAKTKNEFVFRFSYFTFENEKGIRFFFVRKFENEKRKRNSFFVRKFENEFICVSNLEDTFSFLLICLCPTLGHFAYSRFKWATHKMSTRNCYSLRTTCIAERGGQTNMSAPILNNKYVLT